MKIIQSKKSITVAPCDYSLEHQTDLSTLQFRY